MPLQNIDFFKDVLQKMAVPTEDNFSDLFDTLFWAPLCINISGEDLVNTMAPGMNLGYEADIATDQRFNTIVCHSTTAGIGPSQTSTRWQFWNGVGLVDMSSSGLPPAYQGREEGKVCLSWSGGVRGTLYYIRVRSGSNGYWKNYRARKTSSMGNVFVHTPEEHDVFTSSSSSTAQESSQSSGNQPIYVYVRCDCGEGGPPSSSSAESSWSSQSGAGWCLRLGTWTENGFTAGFTSYHGSAFYSSASPNCVKAGHVGCPSDGVDINQYNYLGVYERWQICSEDLDRIDTVPVYQENVSTECGTRCEQNSSSSSSVSSISSSPSTGSSVSTSMGFTSVSSMSSFSPLSVSSVSSVNANHCVYEYVWHNTCNGMGWQYWSSSTLCALGPYLPGWSFLDYGSFCELKWIQVGGTCTGLGDCSMPPPPDPNSSPYADSCPCSSSSSSDLSVSSVSSGSSTSGVDCHSCAPALRSSYNVSFSSLGGALSPHNGAHSITYTGPCIWTSSSPDIYMSWGGSFWFIYAYTTGNCIATLAGGNGYCDPTGYYSLFSCTDIDCPGTCAASAGATATVY